MQFLIDFAGDDKDFQNLVARATDYPTVQGVTLDVDRVWMRAWTLAQRWGDERANRWFDRWIDYHFGGGPRAFPWDDDLGGPMAPQILFRPLERKDVESWRPNHWGYRYRHDDAPGEGWPLIAKICLRPRHTREEPYPSLEGLDPRSGRFQVEIETRARAQLTSDPRKAYSPLEGGVSIGVGATDFGTLGVILQNSQGGRFGLTCSHVAATAVQVKQPSQRDSSSPSLIGPSVWSASPVACLPHQKCAPGSGHSPNLVDLSLIDLGSCSPAALLEVLDIGPLTGVMPRSDISPFQPVEVMGRTSRYSALEVGGLAAWYSFNFNGQDYCFQNLFEVQSPYAVAGVIKPGDSGAPVCANDAKGTAWAGMIVGRDAYKGYAMYSETIDGELAAAGYALSVN
jgi:hypothetical protein